MRLIECLDCRTENTLNSRFCRACGGKLPEDAIIRLKAENHNLVQDAKMLFGDHRFEECKMMVESVLEVEPNNIEALALLGDCYEREGRLHDAIELYEKVVNERPDSAIDRVRLTHLRKLVDTEELAVAQPQSRRTALLAGIAGTVLFFSVGAAFMLANQPKETKDPSIENLMVDGSLSNDAQGFRTVTEPGTGSLVPPRPTYTDPDTEGAISNPTDEGNGGEGTLPRQSQPTRVTPYNPNRSGTLSGISGSLPSGNEPYVPPIDPNRVSITPNSDPDPTSVINPGNNGNNGNSENNGSTTEEDPKKEGIYEITVNDNKPGTTSNNNDAARSVEALIEKARDLFVQGNYSQAIKAYEAALQQGAAAGSTNQRIAQCYEKLGNRAQAIASYRKAISSYQASIDRNGGTTVIKNALKACEQAVKNLGG